MTAKTLLFSLIFVGVWFQSSALIGSSSGSGGSTTTAPTTSDSTPCGKDSTAYYDEVTEKCLINPLAAGDKASWQPHLASQDKVMLLSADNVVFLPFDGATTEVVNLVEFLRMFKQLKKEKDELATELSETRSNLQGQLDAALAALNETKIQFDIKLSNLKEELKEDIRTVQDDVNTRQKALVGTCNSGAFVTHVNEDGTFVCTNQFIYTPDFSVVQKRVATGCNAGNYVQALKEDGTPICAKDSDTVYTPDFNDVQKRVVNTCTASNSFLKGLSTDGTPICANFVPDFSVLQKRISTTCTASNSYFTGVDIAGTPTCTGYNPDFTNTYQKRVSTSCAAGSSIRQVNADGSVVCDSPDFATIQKRVSGTCGAGSYVSGVNQDGTVVCSVDPLQVGDADVLKEQGSIPVAVDEDNVGTGWSGTVAGTLATAVANQGGSTGFIHGPFGGGSVSKVFDLGTIPHTRVQINVRLFSIDSFDNENVAVAVDDVEVFNLPRTGLAAATYCTGGWTTYQGPLANPFQSDRAGDKCSFDAFIVVPHVATTAKITISSNINEAISNEAWAFQHLEIFVLEEDADYELKESGKLPWISDDDAVNYWEGRPSDGNTITNTGGDVGFIHGVFGTGAALSRTFFLGSVPHTHLRVKLRYWAIDSWDGEYGSVSADGVEIWKLWKSDPYHCVQGWSAYTGSSQIPNPWDVNSADQKCFYDVDITIAHSSSFLTLALASSISSATTDESWAFNNVEIYMEPFKDLLFAGTIPFYYEKANVAGWSYNGVGNQDVLGNSVFHGIYDVNTPRDEKTFNLGNVPHFFVNVKLRFWAIDSWDGENGYVAVDGTQVWVKGRSCCDPCESYGWASFSGALSNPWNGDSAGHKCWTQVDVMVPHTSSSLKLAVYSNIAQTKDDESWGFDDVRLSLQ